MIESFFVILKSEGLYGYEMMFKSINQLEQVVVDFIDYYNKTNLIKLKRLNPLEYRTKSFG
ncbi:hypothetical protein DW714_09125 [Streptococcus anginosus]|nr:hypothetical protein DW714_09125 [Streptococcus anginosus]